jgi:hypothetical protein
MDKFVESLDFPDKSIAELARDILIREGVNVSQLGTCITNDDLEEIGIPEAARRILLQAVNEVVV